MPSLKPQKLHELQYASRKEPIESRQDFVDLQGFTGYFWARILYCFLLLIEELSRKSLFIQESRPFLLIVLLFHSHIPPRRSILQTPE